MTQPPRCPGLAGCKNENALFVFTSFIENIPLRFFLNVCDLVVNHMKSMKEIELDIEMLSFMDIFDF